MKRSTLILALLLLAVVSAGAVGWLRARSLAGAARDADAVAKAATVSADSARKASRRSSARADSIAARADSLAQIHRDERDSISALLAGADSVVRISESETDQWSATLDSSLAALAREVRPALRPVVRRALLARDSIHSNVARLRAGWRESVRLLAADTTSLRTELGETRVALRASRADADSLRSTVRADSAAIASLAEARDRWRDIASAGFFESLFGGPGLVRAATTVAGAAVAFRLDPKVGAGFVGAKLLDVAVSAGLVADHRR